jgi:hypothetical protein
LLLLAFLFAFLLDLLLAAKFFTLQRVAVDGADGTWSVSPADSGHGGLIWTMPGRSAE